MSKFYKQRSKNVNDAIKQRIIGAVKNFEGKYTESQVFKHSLSKGEYREQPIQEFFRELLPNKFAVLSGEIIDYKGNVSPQSDLIIYRNIDGIPVFKTEPTILLAESVMSIIEVKSKINLDEYEDCLKKAESNGIRRIQQEAGAYMKDLIDEKNRQEKMKRSIIKYWNVSYGSPEAIGGEEEEKEREHAAGIYPQ